VAITHPLRRRERKERPVVPAPELDRVLGNTLGMPSMGYAFIRSPTPIIVQWRVHRGTSAG
jgi:hypothetical protein